jgi:hypothetical protein
VGNFDQYAIREPSLHDYSESQLNAMEAREEQRERKQARRNRDPLSDLIRELAQLNKFQTHYYTNYLLEGSTQFGRYYPMLALLIDYRSPTKYRYHPQQVAAETDKVERKALARKHKLQYFIVNDGEVNTTELLPFLKRVKR